MPTVKRKSPVPVPNNFAAYGQVGAAGFELKLKLAKHAKLFQAVRFIAEQNIIQFVAKATDEVALTAALKGAGVTQSESYIPRMPGRMCYTFGGERFEVQIQKTYPGSASSVLA